MSSAHLFVLATLKKVLNLYFLATCQLVHMCGEGGMSHASIDEKLRTANIIYNLISMSSFQPIWLENINCNLQPIYILCTIWAIKQQFIQQIIYVGLIAITREYKK